MYIFIIVMTVFLNLILILCGRSFQKHPPKSINSFYGYRTSMSMKNKDTWDFAHKTAGEIWIYSGLLSMSIFTVTTILCRNLKNFEYISLVIIGLEVVVMLAVIPMTEIKLKKVFDKNGVRR